MGVAPTCYLTHSVKLIKVHIYQKVSLSISYLQTVWVLKVADFVIISPLLFSPGITYNPLPVFLGQISPSLNPS